MSAGSPLGDSELFTDNFLVPWISAVARRKGLRKLARLWARHARHQPARRRRDGREIKCLALPSVHESAATAGSHYAHLGASWQSFFLAVLAGARRSR